MAYDIGIKVGVDGESEYKRAIADMNRELKTTATEMKLVTSEFDKNDNSVKALTARNGVLTKEIGQQKDKVETLRAALDNAKTTYGENSSQVQKWQQQLNNAQARLNDLNRELGDNEIALRDSSRGYNEAGQRLDQFGNVTKDANDSTLDLGAAMSAAAGEVGMAIAAITAVIGVLKKGTDAVKALGEGIAEVGKKIVEVAKTGATYADTILTESTVTGIAAEKLQEYYYAAELVDVSVDTLTKSMAKQIKSMAQAREGTKLAVEAYESLGIKITDAEGNLRDSDTVYWEIIEALGRMTNDTERDAVAMQLLGKSAQDLNPLIAAGAQRMRELGEEAKNAGYVLSSEALASLGAFDDQIQKIKNDLDALTYSASVPFADALAEYASGGEGFLAGLAKAVQDADGDIGKAFDNIGAYLPGAINKLAEYIPEAAELGVQLAETIADSTGKNAGEIIDTLLDALLAAQTQLTARIPRFVGALRTTIVSTGKALLSPEFWRDSLGVNEETAKVITRELVAFVPEIIGVFSDYLAQISVAETYETGYAIIETLIDSIVENAPQALEKLAPLFAYMLDYAIESGPLFVDGTIKLVEKIVTDALPKLIPILGKGVTDIAIAVGDRLIEASPTIFGAVLESVWAVLAGIVTQGIPNLVYAVIDGLKEALKEASGYIFGGGLADAFDGYTLKITESPEWIGIAERMLSARDYLKNQSFKQRFGDEIGSASELGRNVGNRVVELLERIAGKDTTLVIGDDQIGAANDRYRDARGVTVSTK